MILLEKEVSYYRFREMAEDEKAGDGISSHGTDWEVISLTASTYAAAPGPKKFDSPDERKSTEFNGNEQESSGDQFLFRSSKHENLPIEQYNKEIYCEPGSQDVNPAEDEDDVPYKTNIDNWKIKSGEGLDETEFFDKGSNLSAHHLEFGEGNALKGLTLLGEEPVLYVAPEHGAFHADTDMSDLVLCDDATDIPDSNDPSHQNLDSPDLTNASKSNEESKHDGSGLPYEAWWKKQAISLYSHVKEANALWPVFVAAAVMGIVIWGHRWRREKLQLQQLGWQSSINGKRMNQMAGSISLLKCVMVDGHQHRPLVRGGATSGHVGV